MAFYRTRSTTPTLVCCILCLTSQTNAFSTRKGMTQSLRHEQIGTQGAPLFAFKEVASSGSRSEGVSQETLGLLALGSVPVILGTYVPLVQLMYGLSPAIPITLFQAAYFTVASVSSLTLLTVAPEIDDQLNENSKAKQTPNRPMTVTDGRKSTPLVEEGSKSIMERLNPLDLPLLGGMEIGVYLFTAATLQVLGLETIPADRAGFLVQTSTILVPVMEGVAFGAPIPTTTWIACLLTLVGIGIMGMDSQEAPIPEASFVDAAEAAEGLGVVDVPGSSLDSILDASVALPTMSSSSFEFHLPTLGTGDWLTIGAACMYTMSILRMGAVTKQSSPLRLTACKSTVEMVLAIGLVVLSLNSVQNEVVVDTNAASAFLQKSGESILQFQESFQQQMLDGTLRWDYIPEVSGAIIYTGVVATALLVLLQSYGQQHVQSPTKANLLYSVQPLCTSFFSFFLLGQTMGTVGYVGASLMLAGLLLVATTQEESTISVEN